MEHDPEQEHHQPSDSKHASDTNSNPTETPNPYDDSTHPVTQQGEHFHTNETIPSASEQTSLPSTPELPAAPSEQYNLPDYMSPDHYTNLPPIPPPAAPPLPTYPAIPQTYPPPPLYGQINPYAPTSSNNAPQYDDNRPPVHPLPLSEAIRQLPSQYWLAISQPQALTYAKEAGKAAWNIIWFQIFIIALMNAAVLMLEIAYLLPYTIDNMPPATTADAIKVQHMQQVFFTSLQSHAWLIGIATFILTPILTFISIGIYQLIARAFGGRGTLISYLYCHLLIATPLTIVNSVITFIPFASIIALPIAIYEIVLQIFMTMGVHRISGVKSSMTILLPAILVFFIICALIGISILILVGRSLS